MSNETAPHAAKGLFAGKARTVAAVAAFSGLALATTVSVQATQNASEQAPAAAVSEAPASDNTVSAEPAAKADKAQENAAKEQNAAKTEKAQPAAQAPAQPSVVQAAPVADVTPLQAPAVPAAAPTVVTASENVTSVAEQAPVAQGRHAAPATAQTVAKEAAAEKRAAVASPVIPNYAPAQGAAAAQPASYKAPQAPAAPKAQAAPQAQAATQVATQSNTQAKAQAAPAAKASSVSGSAKGQAILGAAEAQLGVAQDCTMLVTNSLKAVGINHHGWPASYKSLGTQVSADQARAGDIAYYANGGSGMAHVAIYAGNGQAIHGGWNGNQTVKTSAYVGSGPEFIRVG
ncbi:NlpC/P60 family protein [Kocuria sp. KD4]|uniref:NlpC/P60 family protein n=1 Tax=Kocuria sp. KD4 TaxID=2719588 RepID=UPI0014278A47|nr:NlpC/P60 family protein [Kocuria sp. KD4]QIR70269.1 hypothetical protein HBK84_09710 [Kocuria sp. KD4]